ncbi:MAG: mechanosensitive ion channel family protein [Xanthomonadales bacterium]|nr:mechanosensitive ion channel family protein [Xanthomonadales bacterium]
MLAEQFGDSAIELAIRVWVPTEHAGPLRSELLLLVKETLERAGIAIPCPQREIRLLGADRPAA